jgi:hypothetical protein
MPQLDIKIVSAGQKVRFAPEGLEVIASAPDCALQLTHAAIMEAGIQSGKTSIALGITYNDQFIICETSLKILEGLYYAAVAAEQRWREML